MPIIKSPVLIVSLPGFAFHGQHTGLQCLGRFHSQEQPQGQTLDAAAVARPQLKDAVIAHQSNHLQISSITNEVARFHSQCNVAASL